jgi:hypothetical protein
MAWFWWNDAKAPIQTIAEWLAKRHKQKMLKNEAEIARNIINILANDQAKRRCVSPELFEAEFMRTVLAYRPDLNTGPMSEKLIPGSKPNGR